jgi:cytochrome P450
MVHRSLKHHARGARDHRGMTRLNAATDTAAPRDAVAAVVHHDPYPFYAGLVASRPFHHDGELNLWVAASAEAVAAVLTHPAGRVRPIGEPVPAALRGSPVGEVFGGLVRMNDGDARHDVPRTALIARVQALGEGGGRIEAVAEYRAHRLADAVRPWADPRAFLQFAFAVPTHVIGSLLGVPDDGLDELTQLVGDLVSSFSPPAAPASPAPSASSASDVMSRGARAARRLGEIFGADGANANPGVANVIGLLTQAQDATAALIATTLLTLRRSLRLLDTVERAPALLADVIEEVVRYDAPVQNTRRYLAEPATILGQPLPAATAILVVLAAANRDPAANAEPASFHPTRPARRSFTFGLGPHACLGQTLATTIARAGVARILASGVDVSRLDPRPAYKPYPNIRLPLLTWRP